MGCGSGDENASTGGGEPPSALATNPALRVVGPSNPAENLERLLAVSTPELGDIAVDCPTPKRPHSYPFSCRLDGAIRGGAVSGEVTVLGIYGPTRTYAYEVSYEPD